MKFNPFVTLMSAKFVVAAVGIVIMTASISEAACGPQVSFNLNKNTNTSLGGSTNDTVGVAEYGDTFNFGTGSNDSASNGLTAGFTISFNLDGGRGCREFDARIAESKDRNIRANRQAHIQEQNSLAAAVDATIKVVTFCETADLEIPAIAELCKGHTK